MSSRAQMLAAIGRSQPPLIPLPLVAPRVAPVDLAETFTRQMGRNGGTVVRVQQLTEIRTYLTQNLGKPGNWVSTVHGLALGNSSPDKQDRGHTLAGVDLAVCAGAFAVAENGAIWLDDTQLPHRALPFLCQHLALVVAESTLVATLHDAYRLLEPGSLDYGVFIAGPSKTADIEQSLVIGAHGSRNLLVFLCPTPLHPL